MSLLNEKAMKKLTLGSEAAKYECFKFLAKQAERCNADILSFTISWIADGECKLGEYVPEIILRVRRITVEHTSNQSE